MRKLGVVLAAFGLLIGGVAVAPPARAADDCQGTVVGLLCLPVPTVLPASPLAPGPITEIPGPTQTVTVPGPTRTVQVPGPTATATVTAPPATSTTTRTVTPNPVTETTRITETESEIVTVPSLSMVPNRTTIIVRGGQAEAPVTTHVVTVTQALTFSVLSLILGGLAVLLVMYVVYRIGRREGEHSVDTFLASMLRITYRRKH